MDSVDLDTLAWRAVELAVQQRHDPRLMVATRATIPGAAGSARLMAGLCNAAAGRRAVALFGIDGTAIIGVAEPPDDGWLDRVAGRFPGVRPALATTVIDADGALVVAMAAEDPGTLVVATRRGRAVIPWFDGALSDQPPTVQPGEETPPAAGLTVRAGWLEHTVTDIGAATGVDVANATSTSGAGIEVWRGMLDVALALPKPPGHGTGDVPDAMTIDDCAVSVTLLADRSRTARSLDVQIHPSPGGGVVRTATGVRVDPAIPCRLYLAAAVAGGFVERNDGAVRLLITVRVPHDEALAATMLSLTPDTDPFPAAGPTPGAPAQRWVV